MARDNSSSSSVAQRCQKVGHPWSFLVGDSVFKLRVWGSQPLILLPDVSQNVFTNHVGIDGGGADKMQLSGPHPRLTDSIFGTGAGEQAADSHVTEVLRPAEGFCPPTLPPTATCTVASNLQAT